MRTSVSFVEGSSIFVTVEIRSTEDDSLMDPADLSLTVRPPALPVYTVPLSGLVRESVGNYRFQIELDEVGIWRFRWESVDSYTGVAEGSVICRKSIVLGV